MGGITHYVQGINTNIGTLFTYRKTHTYKIHIFTITQHLEQKGK